jgi:RNA polymerase sigma factor for flagellar operon FliA
MVVSPTVDAGKILSLQPEKPKGQTRQFAEHRGSEMPARQISLSNEKFFTSASHGAHQRSGLMIATQIEQDLWDAYFSCPGDAQRNALVEHYHPFVVELAGRECSRLPNTVQHEDMVTVGVFGLMEAIKRFDPGTNATFTTFARARVIGAMRDEIRQLDWVPRLARQRQRAAHAARDRLRQEKGHEPNLDEVTQAMGMDPKRIRATAESETTPPTIASIHAVELCTSEGRSSYNQAYMTDARQPDPSDRLNRREILKVVMAGMSRLERTIILLYYCEAMSVRS